MLNLKNLINKFSLKSFLINKREALHREIEEKERRVHDILNGFKTKHNSLIPFKTLKNLPLDVWHYIDGGRYKLIESSNTKIVFITEMEPGGCFGVHEHDCDEKVTIVEGELRDDSNNVLKKKGQNHIYQKGVVHKPYSNIKSVYEVVFTN